MVYHVSYNLVDPDTDNVYSVSGVKYANSIMEAVNLILSRYRYEHLDVLDFTRITAVEDKK